MPRLEDLEHVLMETRPEWRAWLDHHHRRSPGIWLVTWKKASGRPVLAYDEAAGLMAPAGQAVIEGARADGSWSRLDAVEDLVVPGDLAAAFDRHPGSSGYWDAFPRSARRGILEWIISAKRPETRARRVEETARLAAHNERALQWRRPS